MPQRKGYRSDRLRRRRRSRVERSQAWILYVLAAAVAFAAVLGAWYVAGRYFKSDEATEKSGYLAVVQLTVPGEETPVAALLVVQDPSGGDPGVYVVPPDLLLEGPNGEYVFAADSMALGTVAQDLGRVVHVPVDAVFTVPVSSLADWAGGGSLEVELERPVAVDIDGETRMIEDGDLVSATDLPAIFASAGNRRDLTALQTSLVQAVTGLGGPAARRRAQPPGRREPVARPPARRSRTSSPASPPATPWWSGSRRARASPRDSSPSCRTRRRSWPASRAGRRRIAPT